MADARAEEFDRLLVRRERDAVEQEAVEHDVRAELGFRAGIGPGDHELSGGLVAVLVGDRDLVGVGRCATAHSADADPVRAVLFDDRRREVGRAVGAQVAGRIAHLVEELVDDGVAADHTAGALVLGDPERAVRPRVDDRVAEVRPAVDLPPARVVASGALGTALDDVAGDGRGREEVVVGRAPAELVHHRAGDQRGVRDAAADHDVRASREAVGDRLGADVDVGAEDAVPDRIERLPGVQVGHRLAVRQQLVDPTEHVVTVDDPDLEPGAALLARQLDDGAHAGARVHASRVGDDLDALVEGFRQDAVEHPHEVRRVARLRVPRAELLHDAHRHLGQVVEGEVVERALTDETDGSEDRISPEALPVGDQELVAHRSGRQVIAGGGQSVPPRARDDNPSASSFSFPVVTGVFIAGASTRRRRQPAHHP